MELVICHRTGSHGAGDRIRVGFRENAHAPLQESSEGHFDFTLSESDRRDIQWYLEAYLQFPRSEFTTRAQQVEALLKTKGAELFQAVFGEWNRYKSYSQVAEDLANTRILIQSMRDDFGSVAIPWELMRDPRKDSGLLAQEAASFVRSQIGLRKTIAPASPPREIFRILLVISRPVGDEIAFQSVARPLLELFRASRDRVQVDVLRPPTLEALSRKLHETVDPYDILHFDGHGSFRPSSNDAHITDPGAVLLFENPDGTANPVSGSELGAALAGKGVPIVVLNACQSGMERPDALYPSIGNQLLQAGVRGVVAMAYSLYVSTAVRFITRLYEGLTAGEPLGRAMRSARGALAASPARPTAYGPIPLQDWMVPILFETEAEFAATEISVRSLHPITGSGRAKNDSSLSGIEVDCPPPPATGFVGQDNVLLTLERTFRSTNVVILQGIAGVGKTETAMAYARWLAETGGLDGPIFFTSFRCKVTFEQVLERIGETLRPELAARADLEWSRLSEKDRRRAAVALLKQIPCLLIWDDFDAVRGIPAGIDSEWSEEEQEAFRLFLADLTGGRTKSLLTGRRHEIWLGDMCRPILQRRLAGYEALDLSIRALKEFGLDWKSTDMPPEFFDYPSGNPLLIRTMMRELKTVPAANLIEHMSGQVASPVSREHAEITAPLAASLNYAFVRFPDKYRLRMAILGMFWGFVSVRVLAKMCRVAGIPPILEGGTADHWHFLLGGGAEAGLLCRVSEQGYEAHPALLWFFHDGMEELFREHWPWASKAYVAAYVSYTGEILTNTASHPQFTRNLLEWEETNILNAIDTARHIDQWNDAGILTRAIAHLLTAQGRWSEFERMVAEAEACSNDEAGNAIPGRESAWRDALGHRVTIARFRHDLKTYERLSGKLAEYDQEHGNDDTQASALRRSADLAMERRDLDEAERLLNESLAIYEQTGKRSGKASCLLELGLIAQERNQLDEAERRYRISLSISAEDGNAKAQALTLHRLGIVAVRRNNRDEAASCYSVSLAISKEIGDETAQAAALYQLGLLALNSKKFEDAESCCRQFFAINEQSGNEKGQSQALHQLGKIAEARRQFDEAERWYLKGLSLSERIEDRFGEGNFLHRLGAIALERKQYEEADRLYQTRLSCAIDANDRSGQASAFHRLGIIAEHRKRYDDAEKRYHQSLAIREQIGTEEDMVATIHQLGRVAEARGKIADAERRYWHSLLIAERIEYGKGCAYNLHQLAMTARTRKECEEAEIFGKQSLAIWERLGDEEGQANTLHELGLIARKRRQYDSAERRFWQSFAIRNRLGNELGQANSLFYIGVIMRDRNRLDEAEGSLRRSMVIYVHLKEDRNRAFCIYHLGMIAQQRRQYEEARQWFEQSIAVWESTGEDNHKAVNLHQLARTRGLQGFRSDAYRLLKASESIFLRLGDSESVAAVRRSFQQFNI